MEQLDRETYEMVAKGLVEVLKLVRPHRAPGLTVEEASHYATLCQQATQRLTNPLELNVATRWARGWASITYKIAEDDVRRMGVRIPSNSLDVDTCRDQVRLIEDLLANWSGVHHAPVLRRWLRGHSYYLRGMEQALEATTDGRGHRKSGRSNKKQVKAEESREQRNQMKGKKVSEQKKYGR